MEPKLLCHTNDTQNGPKMVAKRGGGFFATPWFDFYFFALKLCAANTQDITGKKRQKVLQNTIELSIPSFADENENHGRVSLLYQNIKKIFEKGRTFSFDP